MSDPPQELCACGSTVFAITVIIVGLWKAALQITQLHESGLEGLFVYLYKSITPALMVRAGVMADREGLP